MIFTKLIKNCDEIFGGEVVGDDIVNVVVDVGNVSLDVRAGHGGGCLVAKKENVSPIALWVRLDGGLVEKTLSILVK